MGSCVSVTLCSKLSCTLRRDVHIERSVTAGGVTLLHLKGQTPVWPITPQSGYVIVDTEGTVVSVHNADSTTLLAGTHPGDRLPRLDASDRPCLGLLFSEVLRVGLSKKKGRAWLVLSRDRANIAIAYNLNTDEGGSNGFLFQIGTPSDDVGRNLQVRYAESTTSTGDDSSDDRSRT